MIPNILYIKPLDEIQSASNLVQTREPAGSGRSVKLMSIAYAAPVLRDQIVGATSQANEVWQWVICNHMPE